jgi:divalent metal cation (Fe/Co/Zn/Cd) transporter
MRGVDPGWPAAIEVISAVGLLWRLRKAGPHAAVSEESAAEKRALYVVAITFFGLAIYVIWEGREVTHHRPLSGPSWRCFSLAVMPTLAFAKQRIGKEMGSRALVADSKATWVCSYLSLTLLLGVGGYAVVGWWWADPVGALAMLPVILWQGWGRCLKPASRQTTKTDAQTDRRLTSTLLRSRSDLSIPLEVGVRVGVP